VVHRLDTGVFAREVGALLAAARWSAADLEQVLATTARIDLADAGSWSREWTAAGGEAWAAARAGDRRGAYLHAASYYGAALALIDQSDGLVAETALWERQRECWDRAVEQLGGQPVRIPYEETTLPGFFFSAGPGRRPVIVVDAGGRIVTSEALTHVGAAAHARGYHWLTFDGPGRQAALRRRGLVLRPDWEAAVRPVVDLLSQRPDVDLRRIAIVGLELGGFGVARALTAERLSRRPCFSPGSTTRRLPGSPGPRREHARRCSTRTAITSRPSCISRPCSPRSCRISCAGPGAALPGMARRSSASIGGSPTTGWKSRSRGSKYPPWSARRPTGAAGQGRRPR
jgi:dipeptidyl aminopeptidase/acylaminoacyl peptidase